MKYTFLAFISISSLFSQIDYGFGFSKGGLAGFQFLKIETGAVSQAFSGAYSASSKDSKSFSNNISRISKISDISFSVSSQDWIAGSKINTASFAFRKKDLVFGINASSFTVEEFEETTVSFPTGTGRMVKAGNYLFGLGLARNFTDKLSLGMQLKYVEENIDNYSYSNVLFDFGSNYETGFRDLNIAFVFQHIGPDVTPIDTKFRSPLMFRIGMSDYVYRIESIKSMMIMELVHPTDSEDYLILAQDLELIEKINLRVGSKIKKSIFGHSFGFGIKDVNISGNNTISIDYSILMSNYVFKDFHSLSISLNR